MSTYGSDINWISAHRDPDRAQQDVDAIKAAGQRGDLSDEEKVVALFERLAAVGDGEPENMGAADITKITASIGGMVFEARRGGQSTGEEEEAEPQPPIDYRYTLPEDDAEVIVSGASMAIIDSVKKPPLSDAHAIQERALWHCEMSRKHIRVGELTNDYEGFKHLFIASYTTVYERDPRELSGSVRDIINRYDLTTALVEIRNIIKGLYFPDLADLEKLAMEYKGILMTPHHSFDGYYATFLWNHVVVRTLDLASPMLALAQAQRMIDKLKTT